MKNINILLFLSDYKSLWSETNPKGAKELDYTLEDSNRAFKGIQTNDAPLRYLFEECKKDYGTVKRILCITSHKVLTEPSDQPQIERFEKFVDSLVTEDERSQLKFVLIPYDYDENNWKKDFGKELPVMIYNQLADCFADITEEEEVYIDYTGGLRDISFLMTSIIRFLEFRGVVCKQIVYSNIFDTKLCDIHYIYDIYQMINGVTEFTNTGNARELKKIFLNNGNSHPAEKLINCLIEFSDTLSICDIGSLDDKVKALEEAITELEQSKDKDINSAMLKTLIPTIREKMYLSEGFTYPKMIKWCVHNHMIQQAATIYTDKMPKYYFDNHMVPNFVDLSKVANKPGQDIMTNGFYTILFDRIAEGIEVELFCESLRKVEEFFKDAKISRNDIKKDDLTDRLNVQKQKEKNKLIKDGYERLILFINKCYDKNLKSITDTYDRIYDIYVYDKDSTNADEDGYVIQKGKVLEKFWDFWNSLIGDNIFWLHFFLYDNKKDYLAITTAKKRNIDKTLRKKIFAIQRVKNKVVDLGSEFDSDRLYKIMAYYLAVKIMRNRMNHAGEEETTRDERIAIEELNKLGLGIDFKFSLESFKQILEDGLSIDSI